MILSLINIYLKINWNEPTDKVEWKKINNNITCVKSDNPEIKPGDILHIINDYNITEVADIHRILLNKEIYNYEIERNNDISNFIINIRRKFTPFPYYILVFSGILFILLTLKIINMSLKKKIGFDAPRLFYLLALSFSGFLIFSPTGDYNSADYLFLFLDRISYIFFPAFLLQFSIYIPLKSKIIHKFKPRILNFSIYILPFMISILYLFFILKNILINDFALLNNTISSFRKFIPFYSLVYLLISLIFLSISNLNLIIKKRRKKFILPLIGIFIGTYIIIQFNHSQLSENFYSYILLVMLMFFPLSITFLLSHKRFTNIENIIKRTISISSIFIFVFGINIFLGVNFERNKFIGLFWSVTAVLTAGLLFKPFEKYIQGIFEKFFLRGSYKFKLRLTELINSLHSERDLLSLSRSFLSTINKGLNLKNSSLIIARGDNDFFILPDQTSIRLDFSFQNLLISYEYLIYHSQSEFNRKIKDIPRFFIDNKYLQFLSLKTQDKLIGVIALGLKTNSTFLSGEDWEILFNISSSLTLSVENASLYTELEHQFNEISLLKDFNENIVNNINLGISVLSIDNSIVFWNYRMENIFKINVDKSATTDPAIIFGEDLVNKIIKHKNNNAMFSGYKIRIREEDFIFDIRVSPLRDSKYSIIGTILVFDDISKKIALQNQLITSEKMASIGLLSSGIAHEINTPLTGISSYCQFLVDNPNDPNNNILIEKMLEQVGRANKIVRSLLDFARQKGEKPQAFDLNHIINKSISLLEHKLKKKNIKIEKEFVFTSQLIGYATRIQQVFINLIINSSDAIEANSNGIIIIEGKENNFDFIIRFKDNGTGIDPKNQKKIFDPFFTTKSVGKGTGLGLSIVYNIIQEHYGKITVNSKENLGTTFYIRFPKESPLRSVKL
jgi:signal transduction histidine kinase